jgi:hypothetical protein
MNNRVPAELTAKAPGRRVGVKLVTELSNVSITETEKSAFPTVPSLDTYTRLPILFTATPYGLVPTVTVADTELSAVSSTVTVLSLLFAMYAKGAAFAIPE